MSAVGHTRPGISFRHLSEKEKDEDAKYTALDPGVLGRLEQVASIWGNFGECTRRSTQENRTLLRTTPMFAEYVVILLHLSTRVQQSKAMSHPQPAARCAGMFRWLSCDIGLTPSPSLPPLRIRNPHVRYYYSQHTSIWSLTSAKSGRLRQLAAPTASVGMTCRIAIKEVSQSL